MSDEVELVRSVLRAEYPEAGQRARSVAERIVIALLAARPDSPTLDDLRRQVEDITDYPSYSDEEDFRDGWVAIKLRVLGLIQEARLAADTPERPA